MNAKKLIINIDGIDYPAYQSMGAMLHFKEQTGKEVNEITGISDSIIWLWCCVKSASAKTDNPLLMDCQEFADSLSFEVLTQWNKAQQVLEAEAKKKGTKGSPKVFTNS